MSWLGVSSIPFSGFCLLIVLSTGTVRKVIVLSTTREATCLESEENQVHATQERNDTMNPEQGTASQMQAIVQGQYGSADILELRTIERPEVAPNEVLIEVYSAGVDRGVWHLMTGLPYLVRLALGRVHSPSTRPLRRPSSQRSPRTSAMNKLRSLPSQESPPLRR
jgi:hypothetical protein